MGTASLDIEGKRIAWDEDKNRKNLRDHQIALPRAARAFLDPFFVLLYDEDNSSLEETRWKGLGTLGDSLLLLCFVERGNELRIYSARKATPKERRI
ncbi:MAG: BrnT family toxin [Treponematales bacterium]